MKNAYILTGNLKSPTMIELDESLSIETQKVRVTIEPIQSESKKRTLLETIYKIQGRQEERDFISPRKEDIDTYISILRDDWS
jgi:hypothetical protein